MIDIVAQSVGFLGLIANVISFQFKDRSKLLLFSTLVCALMAVHFLLLGAYTGALLFTVAIFRALVFQHYSDDERPVWPMYLFLGLFLLAGALTWHGLVSLLPMISTIFVTIGLWQKDTQKTRKLVVIGPVLWTIHNLLVGSIAGVINEIISFVSILVGLWRHRAKSSIEAEITP